MTNAAEELRAEIDTAEDVWGCRFQIVAARILRCDRIYEDEDEDEIVLYENHTIEELEAFFDALQGIDYDSGFGGQQLRAHRIDAGAVTYPIIK